MALRIRKDGTIWCAALTKPEDDDLYIDDALSYKLTVERRLLVTYPMDIHKNNPQWFWSNNHPDGMEIW